MVTYPKDWTEKTFEQFIKIKRGASPRPIEAYLTKSHNGVNWIKIGDASRVVSILLLQKKRSQNKELCILYPCFLETLYFQIL